MGCWLRNLADYCTSLRNVRINTMPCPHRQQSKCAVANTLAGRETIDISDAVCHKCSTQVNKQSVNSVTCGIAHMTLVQQGDTDQAASLFHCLQHNKERRDIVVLNHCHHKYLDTCRLATKLIDLTVPTTSADCEDCIRTTKPRQLNEVTCRLALAHVQNERKKKQIVEILLNMQREVLNQPGTALKRILHKIGIAEPVDCSCDEYAAKMDKWGTQGCEQRKQDIIDHLNAQKVSWFDMLKVAAAGYLTTESLVNHAIALSKDPSCTQKEPLSSP